jgi:hypothetical protein
MLGVLTCSIPNGMLLADLSSQPLLAAHCCFAVLHSKEMN